MFSFFNPDHILPHQFRRGRAPSRVCPHLPTIRARCTCGTAWTAAEAGSAAGASSTRRPRGTWSEWPRRGGTTAPSSTRTSRGTSALRQGWRGTFQTCDHSQQFSYYVGFLVQPQVWMYHHTDSATLRDRVVAVREAEVDNAYGTRQEDPSAESEEGDAAHQHDHAALSPDSDPHGKRAFNIGVPKDSDNTSGTHGVTRLKE